MVQAIGAEGVIPAECKAVVKQYVPEIMKAIITLPADEVLDLHHASHACFSAILAIHLH